MRIRFAVILAVQAAWALPAAAQSARPELFGAGTFSTGAYELPPTFTPDGNTAYFTISTPAYGRLHMIMETKRQGSGWSTPQLASFSGRWGDADPIISPDGSRLYFLSRRPAPGRDSTRQDFDIWFVARQGNGWGEPKHVAAASGPMDEHYASATADGTLYISAVRPDTRGRGEIYRVPFVNGSYGAPELLGPEVNSPDHTTPLRSSHRTRATSSSGPRAAPTAAAPQSTCTSASASMANGRPPATWARRSTAAEPTTVRS